MATRAVLGIDAAWTVGEPSGVALAAETGGVWRLVAVAPTYREFQHGRDPTTGKPSNHTDFRIEVSTILAAADALAGRKPDLIAVDMPLALTPIVGRRPSDNAISRAYGAK